MRVENAHDAGLHTVHAVVGHGHGLREPLGLVVHAARAHRVHVAPVVLPLRVHQGVAVDLGGGGEKEARPLGLGQPQRVVGAQAADLQGLDGHAQVIDGGGGAGEVEDEVERAGQVDVVGHVVLDEHEVAAGQVLEVGPVARDEVVHADDGVPAVEEVFGEMRSDEPCPSRHQRAGHLCLRSGRASHPW